MRVLVTGATGFIGSYLVSLLSRGGDEVHGKCYPDSACSNAGLLKGTHLIWCDVRDREEVESLVQAVKPQRIYHLAAQSLPTLSWKEPALTIETNVVGTVNVFEAVCRHGLDARVLVACSSDLKGDLGPLERKSAMEPKVSLVIPTFNEEKNLPHVLPRIPRLPEICEVLLVDGDSTDGTVEMAQQLMPDIRVIHQQGRGKGNATLSAARVATGEYFLVLDADGSHRPEEIPAYIAKAKEGYDLVKGNRYLPGGGTQDETGDRGLLVHLTDLASNILWGARFQDMAYGMFLVHRQKFLDLGLQGQYFELEWEMLLKAHKRGLKLGYVPAFEDTRRHGRSHLTYRRDGWRIFKVIVLGGLRDRITAAFRSLQRKFPSSRREVS